MKKVELKELKYSSKSSLSDTNPELTLTTNILERITRSGHGITGGDVITVDGQRFSVDRTLTWFRDDEKTKNRIRLEVHANHDWTNRPKADIKKCDFLIQSENLIDVFLNEDQIKKWCNQIISTIRDAMDYVDKGKRIYRSIYQNKGVLYVSNNVGVF